MTVFKHCLLLQTAQRDAKQKLKCYYLTTKLYAFKFYSQQQTTFYSFVMSIFLEETWNESSMKYGGQQWIAAAGY